jgi:hypothetical protein
MKTHNGKIARLPREIRDELNLRLDNGGTETAILPWLNALPSVQSVLAAQFGSRLVSPQNLTNWRQGGYQDWLKQRAHQHLVRQVADDANKVAESGGPGITGHISTVLTAELLLTARAMQNEPASPAARFGQLREMLQTVSEVRREDYLAGRLALDNRIAVLPLIKVNQGKSSRKKSGPSRWTRINRQILRRIARRDAHHKNLRRMA